MTYDEFVGHVQNRARLGSTGDAVKAIRATLETLGERLFGGEADELAAQLPQEIGEYLRSGGEKQKYSLDEFLERVNEREGIDKPDAVYHVRVVLEVVGEAVSKGEIEDARAQLPQEFNSLFSGSSGQMNP